MRIPDDVGSKYRLIVLAGLRVGQLQKGAEPRVASSEGLKYHEVAVEEILQEKVTWHNLNLKLNEDENADA